MNGRRRFGGVFAKVGGSRFSEMAKLALRSAASDPVQTHIHRFEAFACNVVGYESVRRGLSVCTGVGDCLWPISSRAWRAGTASQQLTKRAVSSASAAEDMTGFMIWVMVMTAQLFGGVLVSLDMKKCPPALLRAFNYERYEASLCTTSTMSLV